MQFVTHRDPLRTSSWGDAGDAISNLLQVYTDYENQRRTKKQQDLENQFKREEFELQKQRQARADADAEINRQLMAAQDEESYYKEGVEGARPEVDTGVDVLPTQKVEYNTDGTVKSIARNPQTDPTKPLEHWKEPAPVETVTTKEIRDPITGQVIRRSRTHQVKYKGEVEEEKRRKEHLDKGDIEYSKLTPEQRKLIEQASPAAAGLGNTSGWIGRDLFDNIITAAARQKAAPEAPKIEVIAGRDMMWAPSDPRAKNGWLDLGPHATGTAGAPRDARKDLLATEISRVQDFRSGLAQLAGLLDEASGTGTTEWIKTKIPNIMTEAFGWGADAKSRQAALDTAKQIIGKAMEGGVLRKEDEVKYLKILPNIKDAPDVARDKIRRLVDLMSRDSLMYLDTLRASGRDTEEVTGLVRQSAREAMEATGAIRGDERQRERDPYGLLTDKEKNLGAPQSNALGLPRVRVDHGSLPRR